MVDQPAEVLVAEEGVLMLLQTYPPSEDVEDTVIVPAVVPVGPGPVGEPALSLLHDASRHAVEIKEQPMINENRIIAS